MCRSSQKFLKQQKNALMLDLGPQADPVHIQTSCLILIRTGYSSPSLQLSKNTAL
jgi:hypothetical protein